MSNSVQQSEHAIQNQIREAISKYLYPLCKFVPCWRINVGQGWIGKARKFSMEQTVTVYPGDVIIKQARPFDTGATPGFSDIIGAVPVTITEDLIGKTLAVFAAIEVKSEIGKIDPDQKNFLTNMQRIGARVGVARSPDDAIRILRGD